MSIVQDILIFIEIPYRVLTSPERCCITFFSPSVLIFQLCLHIFEKYNSNTLGNYWTIWGLFWVIAAVAMVVSATEVWSICGFHWPSCGNLTNLTMFQALIWLIPTLICLIANCWRLLNHFFVYYPYIFFVFYYVELA